MGGFFATNIGSTMPFGMDGWRFAFHLMASVSLVTSALVFCVATDPRPAARVCPLTPPGPCTHLCTHVRGEGCVHQTCVFGAHELIVIVDK